MIDVTQDGIFLYNLAIDFIILNCKLSKVIAKIVIFVEKSTLIAII